MCGQYFMAKPWAMEKCPPCISQEPTLYDGQSLNYEKVPPSKSQRRTVPHYQALGCEKVSTLHKSRADTISLQRLKLWKSVHPLKVKGGHHCMAKPSAMKKWPPSKKINGGGTLSYGQDLIYEKVSTLPKSKLDTISWAILELWQSVRPLKVKGGHYFIAKPCAMKKCPPSKSQGRTLFHGQALSYENVSTLHKSRADIFAWPRPHL